MSDQNKNDLYNNLGSDAFLRATMKTRLSLLGKELYDNIENLILDENILSNAFKKRNLDKKTIYSSNKFKLNLDELNSDSASVENVLIEEKHREILFKGEEDDDNEENEKKEEIIVEKKKEKEDFKDIFGDMDNIENIENKTQKQNEKNKNDNTNDTLYYKMVEDNEDNLDKNKNVKPILESSRTSTLVQDISDYNQEYGINAFLENDLNRKYNQKNIKNSGVDELFDDLFSEDEKDKEEINKEKNAIEDKEKLEKEKMEQEKLDQEKKKDILKGEYYPIDIIEEAEKYYNLSNESKEDLYPLNTYQTNHGLCIDFLKYQDPNIQTKIEDDITVIGTDNENYLYICTNKGKIIKKKNRTEILLQKDTYNDSISCIDVIDSFIVTGDENGNIAIWINNNFNQVLTNVNDNKIICIKIIEIINSKLKLLYSDIKGNFYFMKVHANKNDDFKIEELEYEFSPIYNILLYPNNSSFIKREKQNVTMILVSPQNLGIFRLNLEKKVLEKLKVIEYLYGEKGKFHFDVSSGLGFPPISDLEEERPSTESSATYRTSSIATNIVIGKEEEEISMISVSYGNVLQLLGFRVSDKNEIYYKDIGFIVNDRPIVRNCFLANSMIAFMTDNFNIKIINTYDFVPKTYNPQTDINVTKNFLISYESMNISGAGLKGDLIDFAVNNKRIQKNIYLHKIISNQNNIFYISDEGKNIQLITLSNYDDVLNNLCDKEDYIKMLWLLSIIFNKNTNLLNSQLNKLDKNYIAKNKKNILDLYSMRFFMTKAIPELQKNNDIYAKMLLEFFVETDYFEKLSEFIVILSSFDLDKYIYTNLTKYIASGYLYEIILDQDILKKYINYCMSKNEKLLLNKILLKLNLDTLLQEDIVKIISEKELINPYIYTRLKKNQTKKKDYFLPLSYLDSVFKKEYFEKQSEEMIKQSLTPEQLELYNKQLLEKKESMKGEIEKNLNISKDYKKLIKEHNMDYFNEDTFSCHEYIGHKFFWYCNKCLSGKEYPNDTPMSESRFKETAIKILAFLLNKENMKLYMEFDSYTYFQIISKYFFDEKLKRFIMGLEQNYSENEKKFIVELLGENADNELNAFYTYSKIKEGLKDIEVNRYFLKYDFNVMTCEICEKVRDFIFDKKDVMDCLLYFSELDINDFNSEDDPYNCHRKVESEKDVIKFQNKIEKYMINLLNYLKLYNLLTEGYVKNLLKKRRIIEYKKIYFYLCEESRDYKECFEIKLLEFEKNRDIYSEKDKKELFSWIKKIHEYTRDLERSEKNKDNKEYNKDFKKLLLQYLNQLCTISIEELSKVIDECYQDDDEKEELIRHLGEGQSSALQLKYLDKYFELNKRDMNENIEKYIKYLDMEIDILIKNRNKRRIKKLLMDYKILCNDTNFKKLQKNMINDCCIYICQYQGKVKEGVYITIKEVRQKYANILDVLDKPNYNPLLIEIELNEMYKYFQLGLSVCQNNFLDEEKEDKKIDDSWLDLFNTACELKIDFYPRYENNKNNIKTRDIKKTFNGLQNCIQLILETMSDYITLNLLVDIIAKNCEKWKTIEFYTFLDKSFHSFRRSEEILKCGKNLMSTNILIHYDDLRTIKTEGHFIYLDKERCNSCGVYLKDNNTYSFRMFACGHKYHISCCAEEQGKKVCYVCRKNEIKGDDEKLKQLKQGNLENEISYLEQEKQEKLEKKLEEKEKKSGINKKLTALKKLRKKRREIDSYMRKNDIYN